MTTSTARTEVIYQGENLGVIVNGTMREWCRRCGGSGHYSFNPQDGTRCFGCNGSGFGKITTEADAKRRADNRRKAAQKRVQKEQERLRNQEADRAAWEQEHQELADRLAAFLKLSHDTEVLGEGVLEDLASIASWRPLTDGQADFATKLLDRFEEKQAAKAQRQAEQAAAGHFGKVGEKIEVEVDIVFTKFIEGSFNGRPTYSTLVIMKTAQGHTLKTFSSGAFGDVEKGQHLTVKGTVKAHEERDGVPETSLTRCKVA